MVSGATVTSDGYIQSLQSALDQAEPVTVDRLPPSARYVEHVMGMPISLALRGRHADDDRGRAAWARCDGRAARGRPGLQHLPRRLRASPGWAAARSTLADCPPEVAEVLALGERARARVRRRVRRPPARPGRRTGPRPERRREGLGGASAPPRTLRALPDTDFCLSAGGDMVCRTADPAGPPGGSASRTRTTRAGWSPSSPVRTGAVATSGTAHRGEHIVDARTGGAPAGVASVTRRRRRPHLGRHRRHRGLRAGRRRPGLAARPPGPPRPGRLARRWQRPLRHRVLTDRTTPRASTRPAF